LEVWKEEDTEMGTQKSNDERAKVREQAHDSSSEASLSDINQECGATIKMRE